MVLTADELLTTTRAVRKRLDFGKSVPLAVVRECIDIATIHGSSSVGSLVAFDEGVPAKGGYRHYRLRSVVGTDDFAAVGL